MAHFSVIICVICSVFSVRQIKTKAKFVREYSLMIINSVMDWIRKLHRNAHKGRQSEGERERERERRQRELYISNACPIRYFSTCLDFLVDCDSVVRYEFHRVEGLVFGPIFVFLSISSHLLFSLLLLFRRLLFALIIAR